MRSILVDTGPLVALFLQRDDYHEPCKKLLESSRVTLFTTWPVITEACHFLGQAGKRALLTFIRRGGVHVQSLSVDDLGRLDELLGRYAQMDFADATIVLLAEKSGVRDVFTIDRRDFESYRTRAGKQLRLIYP